MKKRILSFVMAVALVLGGLAFYGVETVYASPILVENESQLRLAVAGAGSIPTTIHLTADIELVANFVIPAGANITLDSAGQAMRSLIATRNMDVIEVQGDGALTIENIGVTRLEGTTGSGINVRNRAGSLIINGGLISNNTNSGVYSRDFSTVVMNGGTISDNTRNGGEGGGIRGNRVTMNGGTISNNSVRNGFGGGVGGISIVDGRLVMNGGLITNNRAGRGGGVRAIVTMNGGVISNNTAPGGGGGGSGGGISGSVTMHGGIISNNTAFSGGGISGTVTMYGGVISNNIAEANGGGILGRLTMHGGTISNNTASNQGGGVQGAGDLGGVISIYGGIITGNSAAISGGGVHIPRRFDFEGGWIFNNSAPVGTDVEVTGIFNHNVFNPNIGAIGAAPPAGIAATAALVVTAEPVTSTVIVNGRVVDFQAYSIDGFAYFRLLDIAYVLSGTASQFSVAWDSAAGAHSIRTGQAHVPVGGELTGQSVANAVATLASPALILDGRPISPPAFSIAGSNYFMLQALAPELGFRVEIDAARDIIRVTTR